MKELNELNKVQLGVEFQLKKLWDEDVFLAPG